MLISFEGGEGSGKGTIARKLAEFLTKEGHEVKVGREPGSVPIAEEIRKVVQKPNTNINPVTELLLYEAARAQFAQEFLKPALEENDIVILDRFYDSTVAYQGYGRGIDLKQINNLNEQASLGIKPDVTFILDVSPEVGLKRCAKHEFGSARDRFEQESLDFHNKVRQGYLELAKTEPRFKIIDAEKNNVDQTFELVKKEILKLL